MSQTVTTRRSMHRRARPARNKKQDDKKQTQKKSNYSLALSENRKIKTANTKPQQQQQQPPCLKMWGCKRCRHERGRYGGTIVVPHYYQRRVCFWVRGLAGFGVRPGDAVARRRGGTCLAGPRPTQATQCRRCFYSGARARGPSGRAALQGTALHVCTRHFRHRTQQSVISDPQASVRPDRRTARVPYAVLCSRGGPRVPLSAPSLRVYGAVVCAPRLS